MQFIDLGAQQARIKDKLDTRIQGVLAHGKYIMGPEVKELEAGLSEFCGARHVLGCANGTDALQLALMALGVGQGDAVFCPSFTFAATAEVVPATGAVPVFVDVDPRTFNIDVSSLERAIEHAKANGLRPTAVIPVDLFGLAADYTAIEAIAAAEGLKILGDSAQGFGATYKGRTTGAIGDIATTSFFPAKPLGCYGDGGAVFTNDDDYAALLESLRVHGKGNDKYDNVRIGLNSRLDTLQAAILLEKLAVYGDEIEARQKVAERYSTELRELVEVPLVPEGQKSVWAQYTLKLRNGQSRTAVQSALSDAGVPSVVYYPMPLHMQTAYKEFPCDPSGLKTSEDLSHRVLSLPMHPYLSADDQGRVIDALKSALQAAVA
ncbi:DegT/DnrJ/EryC1/StrS family aminotransferase [Roseovarius sp. E0-M6]|uniref:DegT/DnrJ/EryC1/StrS family aminotransferase n=1 Tax=Roseovarius sp. E0-M6 TaxID=3127118 RepID=UPI0030104148